MESGKFPFAMQKAFSIPQILLFFAFLLHISSPHQGFVSGSLQCDWIVTGPGRLTPYINPHVPLHVAANTRSDCQSICVSQTSFICAAVNYRQSDRTCELLAENNQTALVSTADDGWMYFVRPICAGIWLPWTARKGYNLAMGGFNSTSSTNLEGCMTHCLQDQTSDRECRSIVASVGQSSTCEPKIYREGDEGVAFTMNSDWQYFNRPIWYLESSNKSSEADVTFHGTIGVFLHIFTDLTIPVSGYLVAWQYHSINITRACSSYAAVWRQLDGGSYQLIAKTLLTPQNSSTVGVRFQFVQSQIVKVRKDDVLSMFTSGKSNGCVYNLISTTASGPQQALVIHNIFDDSLSEGNIQSSTNYLNRKTSLKAYISDYLALKSAPIPYHNDDLTDGQIWLRVPPHISGEDSTVAAGYRIICSTDINLAQSVSCYHDLVSVNSRNVLLTLPDVTRPVYAAVQIVRNVNAEELPEDKYSLVSDLFCPERAMPSDVDVSEHPADDVNEQIGLVIMVKETFTNDECAKMIKLVVSSLIYDSGYRTIGHGGVQPSFNITVERGSTYTIELYLKLADGYEMVFWQTSYIKPPTPTISATTPTTTTTTTTTTTATITTTSNPATTTVLTTTPIVQGTEPLTGVTDPSKPMTSTIAGGAVGGFLALAIIVIVLGIFLKSKRLMKREQRTVDFAMDLAIDLETEEPDIRTLRSVKRKSDRIAKDSAIVATREPTMLFSLSENETEIKNGRQKEKTNLASTKAKDKHLKPALATGKAEVNGSHSSTPIYENAGDILGIAVGRLHPLILEEKMKNPKTPFKEEFLNLNTSDLSFSDGRTPENYKKNRFKNVTAFDVNRVKLAVTEQHPSDYVNASYITDYYEKVRYIACQGPIESTVVDMWRLIDKTEAKVIVMITNLVEMGKIKCHQYWPDNVQEPQQFGSYSVSLLEETRYAFYTVRKLQYTIGNRKHTVTQFHYTEWYDKDIPSTAGLLSLRSRVKQEERSGKAPTIVHCSAGVGRTGTYIALDNLMQQAGDHTKKRKSVDIFRCVNLLRAQRMFMVQTHEQYASLYDMVSEAVSCGDTSILCSEFTERLSKWRYRDTKGVTTIQKQFTKMNTTSAPLPDEYYSEAVRAENAKKNRDDALMPLNFARVLISHPEEGRTNYINASFCNGYQRKDGFIATQTPLTTTVQDYWRMIVERECRLVIYFNDCLEESVYWPLTKDESIKAGQITITNISSTEEKQVSEIFLNCKDGTSAKSHEVKLIEIKMEGEKLPSSQQLVKLCQEAERHTSSKKAATAVQCRNGSRLCGLFVVAMNLYLRARIEQEIDIVLEVKLARQGRPQFISDLAQFEALYDFVEYYLSEFNEYSNFTDIRKTASIQR